MTLPLTEYYISKSDAFLFFPDEKKIKDGFASQ
jgi:hypothetical protein